MNFKRRHMKAFAIECLDCLNLKGLRKKLVSNISVNPKNLEKYLAFSDKISTNFKIDILVYTSSLDFSSEVKKIKLFQNSTMDDEISKIGRICLKTYMN